jgi:hypothetical protein
VVTEAAAGPVLAASGVRVAFAILELVIFGSWVLLFAILIGMLVYMTVLRGRRERRRLRTPPVALHADPRLPDQLAEMRRADPHFDEQLLRDAAQMACLIMFAAMVTGDEQAIRRLATPSFWSTVFGRYLKTLAHDARVRRTRDGPGAQEARQRRLPVDYQAGAPELIDLAPGSPQRARVRVSFSQLMAMMGAAAQGQARAAAATSIASLVGGLGQAMGQRMDGETAGLDWLSWDGQYDLAFTRPAGSQTDPSAALASRTCAACGRAYRSELATACEYCQAERPTPWGQWRLANVTVVDE